MGLSSNQARFLSLTARQIDLEHRMQQICQRRLRLSSQMQRAAQSYNDQTSDRRIFLNNASSYSSVAPGEKGPLTHDILTDNNVYELLTPQNLYDNGLHLFMDGNLLNVLDDGTVKRRTGNTVDLDQGVIGNHSMGDWVNGAGNISYRIIGLPIVNPHNINTPPDGATPDSTTPEETSSAVSGAPSVAFTGPWVGNIVQDPTTGYTTATYTRENYFDTAVSPVINNPPAPTTPGVENVGSRTTSGNLTGPENPLYTQSNPYHSPWVGEAIIEDSSNGTATQIFKRDASYDTDAGTETRVEAIKQATIGDLGTLNAVVNINGVNFNQYTYKDYANRTITRLAIGEIDAAQGKAQLQALATASNTITNNFVLMNDINLAGEQWGVINSFAGIFDGNLHTISGIEIDTTATPNSHNLGFFGRIENAGTVKNLDLDGVTISTGSGVWEVGSLAGANYGNVNNVKSTGINISIVGNPTNEVHSSEFENGKHTIGGLLGGNSGSVDKVAATGLITINAPGFTIDGVGSLIGTNGSTSSVISSSMAEVDIKTNADIPNSLFDSTCVNTFVGCDYLPGTYANCYTTSKILNLDGSARADDAVGYQNKYFSGHSSSSDVTNCYKILNNGTYAYWNGSGVNNNAIANSGAYNNTSGQWSTPTVLGTPIWNTAVTPPTLNLDTLNNEEGTFDMHTTTEWEETYEATGSMMHTRTSWTDTIVIEENSGTNNIYQADEYENLDISSEELDTRLRSGEIQLARHADAMTQNVINYEFFRDEPESFELIDWRTQPIISDDLYEENDAEAQTLYEKAIRDVNAQDKQLELEQNNVETEYKAITSEKESVNKILDTNIKASFKYFG